MWRVKVTLFLLDKDASFTDLDEQIDFLSSIIAKQQVSDVRESGLCRPFYSLYLDFVLFIYFLFADIFSSSLLPPLRSS